MEEDKAQGPIGIILDGLEGLGLALDDLKSTLNQRLDGIEKRLDSQDDALAAATVRLDSIDLNGHGPDIRALANVSAKLVTLAEYATPLIAEAKERSERTEFRLLLAKRFRIPKLTKALYACAGFILAAVAYAVAQHYIGPYVP